MAPVRPKFAVGPLDGIGKYSVDIACPDYRVTLLINRVLMKCHYTFEDPVRLINVYNSVRTA